MRTRCVGGVERFVGSGRKQRLEDHALLFMRALLIPVKDPANAKTRLAELLSLDERRRLAWAMFEDVSRAVHSAREPDCVVMVTSYAPAIKRARELGWEVLIEE